MVDLIKNPSGRRSAALLLTFAIWNGDLALAKGDLGNVVDETIGGERTDLEMVEVTGIVETCSIETHGAGLPNPPPGPVIAGIVPEPMEIGVDIATLVLFVA